MGVEMADILNIYRNIIRQEFIYRESWTSDE